MIFVLDVGNTNTVLGLFRDDELVFQWRIQTDRAKTEDEYGILIKSLFREENIELDAIEGIIFSTVVPPITTTFERMIRKHFKQKPLVVGAGVKTGLNIKVDNPKEVGADRIVNAVAAIHEYGSPLIIVDFGTATTFCYVNEQNHYLGGAIMPGIGISTEALYTRTAKLPRIEIARPAEVIGKNTIAAMQSGIYFGYIGQVEGIVKRMKRTTKKEPRVIATGGLAKLLSNDCEVIDVVDPALTLKGLYTIYMKNKDARS
ncbi:MAG: type III pantothenate kinase [Bacilli bacterium]